LAPSSRDAATSKLLVVSTAHAGHMTKEVTPTMNPLTIDSSSFQLHAVKYELTDVLAQQFHLTR
jgi:hypothetical protein